MPLSAVVFALALAGSQQAALPDQLVISMVITDDDGNPISDMEAGEFEVREGGKARPVVRAELDRRPLTAVIVLDSSAELGNAYQSDFIPAVLSLIESFPEGTDYTVWTTSDRPRQTVPSGTPAGKVESLLRSVAPFGSNAAVHTIVEASRLFDSLPDDRRGAVFIVSSATMGQIQVNVPQVLPKASMRPMYLPLEIIVNQQDARLQSAFEYLAARTAGRHERVFSTMAAARQVEEMLEYLDAQYRVAWQPAMDPRQAKLEFRSKRRDTKAVPAQRLSTSW